MTDDNTTDEPQIEERDGTAPKSVQDALQDADNVTGAEFIPPGDLDGYYDEPYARFGLWVGDDEDSAELQTFELNGLDQIEGMADAFEHLARDARALVEDE